MRKMAGLGLCLLLCGCISLYESHYQGYGVELRSGAHKGPELVVSENYEADKAGFLANGMVLMGESGIEEYGRDINREEILALAKKKGASYVLAEKRYDHTERRTRVVPEQEKIETRGPHGEKYTTTVTKDVERHYEDTVYQVRTGYFVEKSRVAHAGKEPFASHHPVSGRDTGYGFFVIDGEMHQEKAPVVSRVDARAEAAGLQEGDRIYRVNNHAVHDADGLIRYLDASGHEKAPVACHVWRAGQVHTVNIWRER